jgi:ribosomal protein S18 acetylase RimI-like enzyme
MEQITIRPAVLNDMDDLLVFEQGVITAEKPFDITIKDGHVHYYNLNELITAPHINLLVAEMDNKLIGCGYARIEKAKHFEKHPVYAYLGFMFVTPEQRGKGVNNKIIEALSQWAIAQNVTEIRLEVYNENLPAIKAYEKAGLKKHMLWMRKGLPAAEL